MRILVTGGAGFLGSHLVESLLKKGHDVIVLDNFWTSHPKNLSHLSYSLLEVIRADISHPHTLSNLTNIDQIYHLACPASPIHFPTSPLEILQTCYLGTKNTLDLALHLKARFLLASTSEIYGQPVEHPQKESYYGNTNSFGPRSCYDEGKRVAEALVYAYRQQHALEVRVARIFNTYGPGMAKKDGRVVSSFFEAAIEGEELVVNGDGKATRCFQFVDDCVRGLEGLMNSEWEGGPVNLGSESEVSVGELAELVLTLVKERAGKAEGKVVFKQSLEDDPVKRRPDCSLAREVLGWEPREELEEGLRKTLDWHLENRCSTSDA
ncbi:related to dTDP-glucose 4,6-dehydratase [Ramularia collo-cygni]|uniref:UDP-glucuronic acid decarboxylase 1 n=1 Tax=Ramularia collo-cygni TaxID=112498 RepID=A0A2D3V0L5_9PEZI|nr:related to dTDP-glucose 4,6-dehydratase [Ramularia collo-cygni]CZT15049.1 related to dTDP-glucose 4,6-dehydratase [Ramularia collo-cygni]